MKKQAGGATPTCHSHGWYWDLSVAVDEVLAAVVAVSWPSSLQSRTQFGTSFHSGGWLLTGAFSEFVCLLPNQASLILQKLEFYIDLHLIAYIVDAPVLSIEHFQTFTNEMHLIVYQNRCIFLGKFMLSFLHRTFASFSICLHI